MMAEQTQTDIRENLQEVGDRLKNAMLNVQIPVRMYQSQNSAERRSGYYIEQLGLERFLDWIVRYYTTKGMGSTEPYQHISALLQAMILLRDQVTNDLERLYILVEQMQLLHERELDAAVAAAVAKTTKALTDPGPQPQYVVRELPALPAPGQQAQAPAAAPVQPVAQDSGAPPAHQIAPIPRHLQDPAMQEISREMAEVRRQHKEIQAQIQARQDQPAPSGRVPAEPDQFDQPPAKGKGQQQGISVPDDDEQEAEDWQEDDAETDAETEQ